MSLEEIKKLLKENPEKFIPNFKHGFKLFEAYLEKQKQIETLQKDELLPLIDKKGNVIGKEYYSTCHAKQLFHPCVLIFAMRDNGNLILHLRSKLVKCPNTIDATASGHVKYNQSIEDGAQCELEEEMNIRNAKIVKIGTGIEPPIEPQKSTIPIHLMHFYFTKWNGPVKINPKEVEKVIEMTFEELEEKLKNEPEKFAPAIKLGFPLLKEYLKKKAQLNF